MNKEKIKMKLLGIILIIISILGINFIKFDNGGCILGILIGLFLLIIPYDMEIEC